MNRSGINEQKKASPPCMQIDAFIIIHISLRVNSKKVNIERKSKGTYETTCKNIVKMDMIVEFTFINLYLHPPSMIPYVSCGNLL